MSIIMFNSHYFFSNKWALIVKVFFINDILTNINNIVELLMAMAYV